MLVDSCWNAERAPASLQYLESIGVNVKRDVHLILVSHWHDDHIRGIADVVRRCSKALVALSVAVSTTEFLELARLTEKRAIIGYSGVTEMADTFEILRGHRKPKKASEDSRLYYDSGTPGFEVWSLSPSGAETQRSLERFAKLFVAAREGTAEWVDPTDLNQLSVVLWIRVGATRILLGADLTATRRGWSLICESEGRPRERAEVFKVPHHGSANAQHEAVWDRSNPDGLLEDKPYALVTPWNRGSGVPNAAECDWLASRTPHAWITSTHRGLPELHPVVRQVLREAATWARTAETSGGHIRLRRPIEGDGAWSFEASESVRNLAGELLARADDEISADVIV